MIDRTSEFTRIYEETYDDVLKYVVCHCARLDDVNEIIQETYLAFYRALKYREIRDSLPYLIGIAKNKIKKHISLLARFKQVSLSAEVYDDVTVDELLADETNVEEEIMIHLEAEEVWNRLKKKKPVIQKVFMMYFYFEMTHKEIAEALKIPESTVKTYLYRTLLEMRKVMKTDDER